MRSWIAELLMPWLALKMGGRESKKAGVCEGCRGVCVCVCVCVCSEQLPQASLKMPPNLFMGSAQFVYEPSHLQNNRQ